MLNVGGVGLGTIGRAACRAGHPGPPGPPLSGGVRRDATKGSEGPPLSRAGPGPDAPRIRIFAVPGLGRNVHDIRVVGSFGQFSVHVENVPFEENPRTGRLSALSAIAM